MTTSCPLRSVAFWAFFAAAIPPLATAMEPPGSSASLRVANRSCGPNSLYLLLRLSGVEVGHDVIDRYYPGHPDGMSMLELKRACADFGLAADVRRCTKADLRELPFPVIAHVRYGSPEEADHYVVITRRLNRDVIEAIDGTT